MQVLKKILPDDLLHYLSHWKNRREFQKMRKSDGEYSLKGFDKLNCIYVHIPKSAGVSINKALFGNMGGGHKTVQQYKRIFGPATFKKYFKFTFVRNPYRRLLSAYLFLKEGGMNYNNSEWASVNLSAYASFGDFVKGWVNENNIHSYYHFIPQYQFICDHNLIPEVDFIGRVETIESDYKYICNKLGVSASLEILNKSDNPNTDWRSYYDNESQIIVSEVYRMDFELFNYSKSID